MGLLGAGVNITVTEEHFDAATGELSHVVATVDAARERKVKGHLHWLSADTVIAAEFRVYGVLFEPEDPEATAKELAIGAPEAAEEEEEEEDKQPAASSAAAGAPPPWLQLLNPNSLVVEHGFVEASLAKAAAPPARGKTRPAFQFQRVGFFCVDDDSTVKKPVFNRIVALKEDTTRKALA